MWATFSWQPFVRGYPAVGASSASEKWMHSLQKTVVLDSRILAAGITPFS